MMDDVKVVWYQVSLGKVDKHISLYRREEESSWLNWSEVDRILIRCQNSFSEDYPLTQPFEEITWNASKAKG